MVTSVKTKSHLSLGEAQRFYFLKSICLQKINVHKKDIQI